MGNDLSKIMAPEPKTITLQGKSYKVSELTLDDMTEFQRFAKQKHKELRSEKLALAKEAYPEGMPAEVFHEVAAPISNQQIEAESETLVKIHQREPGSFFDFAGGAHPRSGPDNTFKFVQAFSIIRGKQSQVQLGAKEQIECLIGWIT